jgi:microcystin-dependent protein
VVGTRGEAETTGDYTPQTVSGDDHDEVAASVDRELSRLSTALSFGLAQNLPVLSVAPTKPRDGNIALADGTNWNPGAGPGIYYYYLGVWHPLVEGFRPGHLADFAGTVVPTGWLACDGSNVSRTTYAALFLAIGTTWGVGDGSTTFGLPDLRRKTTIGSGGVGTATVGNAVSNTGGEENHALITAELASHLHSVSITSGNNSVDHTHGGSGAWHANVASGRQVVLGGGVFCDLPNVDGTGVQSTGGASAAHTHLVSGNTGNNGSGTAHNTMQPSTVVTKMIKT